MSRDTGHLHRVRDNAGISHTTERYVVVNTHTLPYLRTLVIHDIPHKPCFVEITALVVSVSFQKIIVFVHDCSIDVRAHYGTFLCTV